MKIFSNPYYFPPKVVRKNQTPPEINPNSVRFAQKMKKFSKFERTLDLTLEGLQFCLLSDYLNEGNNIILDLLVDNLNFKTISTYTEDRV